MFSSIFGKKSPEELIKLADEYFNKNDFNKALDIYIKALEQKPNDYQVNNMVGVCYSRQGNWKDALNYFLYACKLTPSEPLVLNNIGQSYYSLSNYKEALKYFTKASDINPKNPKYLNSIGNTYFSLNEIEKASDYYRKACNLEPNNQTYRDNLSSTHDKLEKLYDKERKENVDNTEEEYSYKGDAKDLLNEGDKFFDSGDYDTAIKYYKQALEKDSNYGTALNNLGAAYSFLEDYENSLIYYKRAVKVEPGNPIYHNNIGLIYGNLGKFDMAVKHYKKAVEINPSEKKYKNNLVEAEKKLKLAQEFEDTDEENEITENSEISQEAQDYLEIATDFFNKEQYEKAINALKKALKIEPNYDEALNLLGNSYTFLDEWESAVIYYDRAVKLNPNIDIYQKNLGNAYVSTKEYKKAIKHLTKAVELNTKYDEAFILIGDSYACLEEWENALSNYENANKLKPNDNYIISNIGYCHSYLGDNEKAIKYYQKALKIDDQDKVSYNLLGNAYGELEEWQKAIDNFKKAVELEPDNALFHRNLAFAYHSTNKMQEAIKEYKLAQKYDPDDDTIEDAIKDAQSGIIRKINDEDDENEFDTSKLNKSDVPENVSMDSILKELNELTGLDNIKEEIQKLIKFIKVEKQREELGLSKTKLTLHRVFTGPPGTGKTTIARLMGKIFKALGILTKGHVVEVDRQNLVGTAWGTTGPKTAKVIEEALDGILFIDEAYSLKQKDDDVFGQDVIDTLVKKMEDNKHRLIVIIAGYPDEMKNVINSNPGLKDRFTKYFEFKDYTPPQLMEIFKSSCGKFNLTEDAEKKLYRYFEFVYKSKDKSFGNARFIKNLFGEISQIQAARVHNVDIEVLNDKQILKVFSEITMEDIENTVKDIFVDAKVESMDTIMNELNNLTGLYQVKKDIETLIKYIKVEKIRKEKGLSNNPITLHSVFYGPPGTGKTTVARLMGKIFYLLGLSAKGHVVEVDRADLVGTHWGQTGPKTQKVLDEAMGGIMFVDEAYTLKQKEDDIFGQDALDTILKRMDDERDKIAVIMAGYTDEMQTLIASNPGLKDRFTRFFYFQDYTPDELLEIFVRFCTSTKLKKPYILKTDAKERLALFFSEAYENKDRSFGNGRFVRNLFEKVIQAMAFRIPESGEITEEELMTIQKQDIDYVLNTTKDVFHPQKEKQKRIGFEL